MSLVIELQPSFGPALVVGGGQVALRKVRSLVEAGFSTTVVAPEVLPEIREFSGVIIEERAYTRGDCGSFAIVFACTNDRETNRRIAEECREECIPVLVADAQDESTFFSPAVHRDGELTVAISTGGAAPRLAQEVRDTVVAALGGGWAERIAAARLERNERLGRNE